MQCCQTVAATFFNVKSLWCRARLEFEIIVMIDTRRSAVQWFSRMTLTAHPQWIFGFSSVCNVNFELCGSTFGRLFTLQMVCFYSQNQHPACWWSPGWTTFSRRSADKAFGVVICWNSCSNCCQIAGYEASAFLRRRGLSCFPTGSILECVTFSMDCSFSGPGLTDCLEKCRQSGQPVGDVGCQ